jgi:hypothetical protein
MRPGRGSEHRLGSRMTLGFEVGAERSSSLDVEAPRRAARTAPIRRSAPGPTDLARARPGTGRRRARQWRRLTGSLAVEAGDGPTSFGRVLLDAAWRVPLGGSALAGKVQGGIEAMACQRTGASCWEGGGPS